jgi:alkyl sulfatase BDS1-like metallo-beta-lactamase superfamily hydrolase
MRHDAHGSIDSLLLSLRSMFDAPSATGFDATITLRIEDRPFQIEIAAGRLRLASGEAERATATLDTDRKTLAALLYGGQPLNDALRTGAAVVTGPAVVVSRFLELFPLRSA